MKAYKEWLSNNIDLLLKRLNDGFTVTIDCVEKPKQYTINDTLWML
jgi:DNA polymerase IIIc chi subunit